MKRNRVTLAAALTLALTLIVSAPALALTISPNQGPTAGLTPVTLQDGNELFATISTGSQNDLFLDAAGHVWAAGINTNGELGNGTVTSSRNLLAPILPAATTFTSVASTKAIPGASFAVTSAGAVWSWGANSTAQLGSGSVTPSRTTPAVITGIPAMSTVSAGVGYAMGLTPDGAVWTWGTNLLGQLGRTGGAAPQQVTGLPAGITAISAGGDFGLALAADGTVWAWGNNASGQLGRGTTTGSSATPQAVTGLPQIAEVSGGGTHVLARATDGRLYSWGGNANGQLGIGAASGNYGTPQLVTIPTVAGVSAGGAHSMVKLADGTSRVWGINASGQLGNNSTTNSNAPITPQLPAGKTVAEVHGGANTSVWIMTDHTIYYAGDNNSGHMGTGSATNYFFVPTLAAATLSSVAFGGTAATGVSVTGANINATTPAHTSGHVPVDVNWVYGTTPVKVTQQNAYTFGVAPTLTGAAGNHLAGSSVNYSYTRAGDELPSVAVTAGSLPPGLTLSTSGVLTGTPTNAGTYSFTLTATNGLGTVDLPDSITITAITVTQDPVDQTVNDGQTATFTASATSLLSPLTVQWQSSTDGGTTWGDIAGATATSYTTPATTLSDSGTLFRAVFTVPGDGNSATTASAELTVNIVPVLVVTNPANQTVSDGDTASFSAVASGSQPITVQWQSSTDGGTTWADVTGATDTTYTTPATVLADSGTQFRAVFTGPGAANSAISQAATLTVNPVPVLVVTGPTDQTVTVGDTASFVAAASGSEPITVQWQSSTDRGATWIDIAGATDTTYTTPATVLSDSGTQFRAVFTGPGTGNSATSQAATLTVKFVPVTVVTNPQNRIVKPGEKATFSSTASGTGPITGQWQMSTDGGSTWTNIAGATSDSYTTPAAVLGDSGQLYRRVFTGPGEGNTATSEAATLSVQRIIPPNPPKPPTPPTPPKPPATPPNPAKPGTGGLAVTGGDIALAAGIGAVLLAGGATLLVLRKRRKKDDQTLQS
ncbi:hypothetical protein G7068_02530 [Leucobacter viscericola]|uniref:Immunoglobulin domain-containing protein n=1 Tax=Leucobacter viscericola TaxID=2714935 RepID=A0A6G7XC66_9MICO|nr:hypothetical protein [Leucobacter viscericola]QIK62200.1 hypothetical protein G7068_02530 [Leucobacter viscericola]